MADLDNMPTSTLLEQALLLSHEDAESDERWDRIHALHAHDHWCPV